MHKLRRRRVMSKYRKKPVVIEAFQMTRERRRANVEWPQWLHEAWNKDPKEAGAVYCIGDDGLVGPGDRLVVTTLEGTHAITFGDWIIQGVKGELYPCKPDIFDMTYEVCDD
jgi:hypothetical protein